MASSHKLISSNSRLECSKILTENLLELVAEHLVERIARTVLSQAYLQLNLLNYLADCCTRIELELREANQ